jgi:hypothetical protein
MNVEEKFDEINNLGFNSAIVCAKCGDWRYFFNHTKRPDIIKQNKIQIKRACQQLCVLCGGKMILVSAIDYLGETKISPY